MAVFESLIEAFSSFRNYEISSLLTINLLRMGSGTDGHI